MARKTDIDEKIDRFDEFVIGDLLVPIFVSMITAIIVTMICT